MFKEYKNTVTSFYNSETIFNELNKTIALINENKNSSRIFFIGNGGSNSICSHMMEDFAKILKIKTYCFSDPALVTCFSNDYGYENAIKEWLKIFFSEKDILIAISSSGESNNIINSVNYVKSLNSKIITLSGFDENNRLKKLGDLNFHVPSNSYGIVECLHQIILHMVLDTLK